MPEYSNGCIYIIKSKDLNIKKVYIGSTCNFRRRKSEHKKNCNNSNDRHYNLNVYRFIRENKGWDEWQMTIVKNFKCNNKKELETEERKIILEYGFDNCLNIQQPTRTVKQYKMDNKEKLTEQMKQYYQNHKEAISQHAKRYYQENKEQIKKYYQENKEIKKKYYEDNKERLNQKFICECGGKYSTANKYNHIKTKKHLRYIEQLP